MRRPPSRESSSIRTKNLSFPPSLFLSLSLSTLSAEREPHNFPSTFSYHSLNALPPFETRTVEFPLACVLFFFFFFFIVSTKRLRGEKRKIRDAISLDRSNTVDECIIKFQAGGAACLFLRLERVRGGGQSAEA